MKKNRRAHDAPTSVKGLKEENKILRERIKALQTELLVDDLTGLYNARYLKSLLEQSVEKMRTKKEEPALLFIDVDYFKSINEEHGHQTGGELLNQIGRLIARVVRMDDIAFRYGGDEFVVLVNGGEQGAFSVGERIRSSIEQTAFKVCGLKGDAEVHLTVSIGIRMIREDDTSRTIMDEADRAMFEAKRNARNTLVAA